MILLLRHFESIDKISSKLTKIGPKLIKCGQKVMKISPKWVYKCKKQQQNQPISSASDDNFLQIGCQDAPLFASLFCCMNDH